MAPYLLWFNKTLCNTIVAHKHSKRYKAHCTNAQESFCLPSGPSLWPLYSSEHEYFFISDSLPRNLCQYAIFKKLDQATSPQLHCSLFNSKTHYMGGNILDTYCIQKVKTICQMSRANALCYGHSPISWSSAAKLKCNKSCATAKKYPGVFRTNQDRCPVITGEEEIREW